VSLDYALNIWRSIRTTFLLFLVVVPIVVLANIFDSDSPVNIQDNLIIPAVGMIIFAGILAEVCRRMINFFVGNPVCRWITET
jgi:FtsH-binding integral membrane protein